MEKMNSDKPRKNEMLNLTQAIKDRAQKYLERRNKNNAAARRSREKRRINDAALERQLLQLKQENMLLQEEIQRLYELQRSRHPLEIPFNQSSSSPSQSDVIYSEWLHKNPMASFTQLPRTFLPCRNECHETVDDAMFYRLSHTSSPNISPISPVLTSPNNHSQFFPCPPSSFIRATSHDMLPLDILNYKENGKRSEQFLIPSVSLPTCQPLLPYHSIYENSLLTATTKSLNSSNTLDSMVVKSNEKSLLTLLSNGNTSLLHASLGATESTFNGSQNLISNLQLPKVMTDDTPLDLTRSSNRKLPVSLEKSDFRNVEQLSGLNQHIERRVIMEGSNTLPTKRSTSLRQMSADERYRERRQRNNEAVRRCRENKRARLLIQSKQVNSMQHI